MRWKLSGPLMMALGIVFITLAVYLWKRELPGLILIVIIGCITFSTGWALRLVNRTACITCAHCGWRGTKRRWREEGCCPSCGGHFHWR